MIEMVFAMEAARDYDSHTACFKKTTEKKRWAEKNMFKYYSGSLKKYDSFLKMIREGRELLKIEAVMPGFAFRVTNMIRPSRNLFARVWSASKIVEMILEEKNKE